MSNDARLRCVQGRVRQVAICRYPSGSAEAWELHPKEDDVDLAGLRLTGVGARDTALLAAALQKGLFGPQDYALLARTPD